MNNKSSILRLLTTFSMVFLAVLAALTADGWRASLSEKGDVDESVNRLLADLNVGVDQLEIDRNRTTAARDAAARLIADLQQPHSQRSEHEVLQDFISAARTGYYDFLLVHDATYRQLYTNDRLGELFSSDIEIALVEYYEYIKLIKSLWASTPQSVNEQFHRATGIPPVTVVEVGELAPEARKQLLNSFVEDPEILDDFRELHAMLSILILNDVFQKAIDSSRDLSGRLETLSG